MAARVALRSRSEPCLLLSRTQSQLHVVSAPQPAHRPCPSLMAPGGSLSKNTLFEDGAHAFHREADAPRMACALMPSDPPVTPPSEFLPEPVPKVDSISPEIQGQLKEQRAHCPVGSTGCRAKADAGHWTTCCLGGHGLPEDKIQLKGGKPLRWHCRSML